METLYVLFHTPRMPSSAKQISVEQVTSEQWTWLCEANTNSYELPRASPRPHRSARWPGFRHHPADSKDSWNSLAARASKLAYELPEQASCVGVSDPNTADGLET